MPTPIAIIGSGSYGSGIVIQSAHIPEIDVVAVADIQLDSAIESLKKGGISNEQMAICESPAEAMKAIEQQKIVVTEDAAIAVQLPVDILVESTWGAESGAENALAAIQHGKHIAMVNKEADVTVGPMLKVLAEQAGCLYSPVAGDQHGLLLDMVNWAYDLGLDIVCAGKALDAEYCTGPDLSSLSHQWGRTVPIPETQRKFFRPQPPGQLHQALAARKDVLYDADEHHNHDYKELGIVLNASELQISGPHLHYPALYATEISSAFALEKDGGLLGAKGVVDAFTCVRRPDEGGFGGGVFVVVDSDNPYARRCLLRNGPVRNDDQPAAVITRPYHLVGIETPTTILQMARGQGVVGTKYPYRPRFDVLARATRPLAKGTVIDDTQSPLLAAEFAPARHVSPEHPLPFLMIMGNPMARDIEPGELITPEMIEAPEHSALWSLRRQQDAHFGLLK